MKYDIDFYDKTVNSFWNSNLMTALLAICGIVISVLLTNWFNKKAEKRNNVFQENLIKEQKIESEEIEKKRQKFESDIRLSQQQAKEKSEEERRVFEKELQKNKIDADIKSTARIEWIQNVRGLAAEYIEDSYYLRNYIKQFVLINENSSIDWENIVAKNIDIEYKQSLYNKIIRDYNLLLLYFAEGDKIDEINHLSNDDIIKSIVNLKKQSKDLFYERVEDWTLFYYSGIKPFRNNMREYLKAEWNRAKKGE